MNETIKYINPPIVEALIDIQVDPALTISPAEIESLHKELSEKYPNKNERRRWETKIELKEGASVVDATPKDQGIDGYQFWSPDKKQICQYRLNGFTLSRLKPYESWEKLLPEAMELWEIYQHRFEPVNTARFAVRFINLIEIPQEKIKLEDYFIKPPASVNNASEGLEHFFQRLSIRLNDNINAITTLALQDRNSLKTTVLLDIDVSSNINIKLPLETGEIKRILKELHDHLINIFEKSITQKTRNLFNERLSTNN
ncbi:MAG: TIGR04255 family protein [Taibaiella sp.]|jgi:uncharacterized protein (TIGR04255 family)